MSESRNSALSSPSGPYVPWSLPKWSRSLVVRGLLLSCLLGFTAWLARAPILTSLANVWIINDKPESADAIVVLGGGIDYRPYAAAKLYKDGFAPKILIMDVALSPTQEIGITQPEGSVTKQVLLRLGVPEEAVIVIGQAVRNTHQESLAVREWAKENAAKRLLIATEIFHTRRVQWLFRKCFKETETEVNVIAFPPREYAATNWWRDEKGLINFQNELVKLPYYWVKY